MGFSRRILLAGLLSVVGLASACAQKGPVDAAGRALEPLTIVTASGDHAFMVEIADDDAERARGLMYRPPLEDDRGMLFQFPAAVEQSFWMKNTPSSWTSSTSTRRGGSSPSPAMPRRTLKRLCRRTAQPMACWNCARAGPARSAPSRAIRFATASFAPDVD